jgi:hypothetical protein
MLHRVAPPCHVTAPPGKVGLPALQMRCMSRAATRNGGDVAAALADEWSRPAWPRMCLLLRNRLSAAAVVTSHTPSLQLTSWRPLRCWGMPTSNCLQGYCGPSRGRGAGLAAPGLAAGAREGVARLCAAAAPPHQESVQEGSARFTVQAAAHAPGPATHARSVHCPSQIHSYGGWGSAGRPCNGWLGRCMRGLPGAHACGRGPATRMVHVPPERRAPSLPCQGDAHRPAVVSVPCELAIARAAPQVRPLPTGLGRLQRAATSRQLPVPAAGAARQPATIRPLAVPQAGRGRWAAHFSLKCTKCALNPHFRGKQRPSGLMQGNFDHQPVSFAAARHPWAGGHLNDAPLR